MSISGSGTRSSTKPQTTSTTSAAPKSPRIRPPVQPQASPSERASRSAIRPAERRSAPGTSTREGVLIGDSGTKRCTSTTEAATPIAPAMKSQRHEKLSTITPERTIPNPPPTPKTALTSPIPTPTFSGGNSSRMIANESGKTAAPAPATARKAMRDQMFQAAAQPMHPARKIVSEIVSRRSLPYWSPSLPRIGVATDATRRKTVSTQVAHVVVVWRSRWKTGSAGTTIVCWSAKAVPASVRTASVTLWCCLGASTPARYRRLRGQRDRARGAESGERRVGPGRRSCGERHPDARRRDAAFRVEHGLEDRGARLGEEREDEREER